ncbi:ABC-2 type transport system ATP-binding protein [Desulfitispora alkaliphila]|uniref:ABC transporter ATP-binding protein n=1 Tax=Desulfitispora alkaliphila TaxID=622674 RepID=UPI003D24C6CC
MKVIECVGLSKSYGKVKAIKDLSFSIEENKITGLIGRNGAGKTTLLKIIAGHLHRTQGELKVFSEDPFNNLKVSANIIFVDENLAFPRSLPLGKILEIAGDFYEHWDMDLAQGLLDYFSLDPDQLHGKLSKGMRSTFNMIVGISSRCPLTVFDEPTTGMDVSVRKDFYRALLKDYVQNPRTLILSSHLLNELENVLEDVLLIKEGEKCLHMSVTDLKELAIGLRGKQEVIDELTKDTKIYHRETLGRDSCYLVVKNDLTESKLQAARKAGVEILPVAVDDICVYLTSKGKGGIDDVFNRN